MKSLNYFHDCYNFNVNTNTVTLCLLVLSACNLCKGPDQASHNLGLVPIKPVFVVSDIAGLKPD